MLLTLKAFLNKITNTGVRSNYAIWEVYLTRKLNYVAAITLINMMAGIVFFEIAGYQALNIDCIVGFFAALCVFFLNKYKGYLWAIYWFYCYGYYFLIPVSLKLGSDSYVLLFYFPVIISMVQLLARKETLKHLVVLSVICLVSVAIVAVGYKYHTLDLNLSEDITSNLRVFHIILGFLTAMSFVIIMVSESLKQEAIIQKVLNEKEILLAEVFHRVKNNMNIVTSLLNLKKNMSESPEVIGALEDCRGRVFAMALVHDNIFKTSDFKGLNFKEYVINLVDEITNTFGNDDKTEIKIEADSISLDLSYAIPCGLILNELITNSFKYAQQDNKKLEIEISLKQIKNTIELKVADNGPGLSKSRLEKVNSLGLELIKSLVDQIGGSHHFTNNNGLHFTLQFKGSKLALDK
jgi:two-component sensor histidine kinase